MNDQRIVVITGGAGGLGIAVTKHFLAHGDAVIVPLYNTQEGDKLLQGIEQRHRARLDATVADVMDEKRVDEFYDSMDKKYGRLDVLVHLVGGIRPWAEVAETKVEDWDFVVNLNLRSTFLNARAAMRIMTRQKTGSIVTVSAMTALKPEARKAAYVTAKAGIIALTRVLADEGRAYNINANAIAPSVIRTAANLEWAQGDEADAWVAPEEIAETIYFLSSPAAHSVNGTVVRTFGKLNI
ncbi:MAG TPA: SDR family NAD(P)-dependent oxidoreductase [Candidatus Kapabacteria bacterium]|nr:SDR family NAD(P)-dependent oxidoreductase [Candidatus Kapabacteria bacterium]